MEKELIIRPRIGSCVNACLGELPLIFCMILLSLIKRLVDYGWKWQRMIVDSVVLCVCVGRDFRKYGTLTICG